MDQIRTDRHAETFEGLPLSPTLRVLLHFRPWLEAGTATPESPLEGLEAAYFALLAQGASGQATDSERPLRIGIGALDSTGTCSSGLDPTENGIYTTRDTPSGADSKAFEATLKASLPDRTIRFLSQDAAFPFRISDGLASDALSWIVAVGDRDLPNWPRLGVAMPTIDNSTAVAEAVHSFRAVYPGEIRFAIVANGTSDSHFEGLERVASEDPQSIEIIRQLENIGYGRGANLGLSRLLERGDVDLFAVSNDDVVPGLDCVCELVCAWRELTMLGYRPGLLGPVSNRINGAQQVEVGEYRTLEQLWARSIEWQGSTRCSAVQAVQVRGLLLLIDSACLEAIGGFDPRFGIGNFEDDDLNLRARLAGFSLWIAEGSFLHHHGSTTFKQLGIDYEANIRRNCETFLEKWRIEQIEDWPTIQSAPEEVALKVPLNSGSPVDTGYPITISGEKIDLVCQASDVEFAAWVMAMLRDRPRVDRRTVIAALEPHAA